MANVITQEVNFEVLALEKANKDEHVVASVKFKGSEKQYTFIRKYYLTNKNWWTCVGSKDLLLPVQQLVIDGCAVRFTVYENTLTFIGIERLYDTKGNKKTDTSNISKKIVNKIKDELEEQNIDWEKVKSTDGKVEHEKYEDIKMCLQCKIPVYLSGPAGSGKNHTVEQIAKELGWDFYFSNSIQQEYKLTGFIDAGGKYHETEFYKACTSENESVFFLDEIDASIPEVLVLLNAAIANGYFEFPNGRVELNNVHFVAAGNTVGAGADELYTGRMVIDQATLDRFAIIEFDYSLKVEMHISNNNVELVEFIRQLREESNRNGIRATFSYRCITMIVKLEKAGMNLQDAVKIAVVKGLDKDTLNTLNPSGNTKYHKALSKVKRAA